MRFISLFRRPVMPVTLNSKDAYSRWASTYPPIPHNPLMEVEQEAMLSLLPSVKDKIVLDLACGSGRFTLIAEQLGASFVFGLDNSEPMLIEGWKSSTNSRVILGDFAYLPLGSASVDVVICALALGHLPDLQRALSEIARVIKPGGHALISDFHPDLYRGGAKRTFKGEGGTLYAVEHYVHGKTDYLNAANLSDLSIRTLLEPSLILRNRSLTVALVYLMEKAPKTMYSSSE